MKKKEKPIPENIKNAFVAFFNGYYAAHHDVKSLSFREMPDGMGYSTVLTYKNFRQYVNYYREEYGGCAVNTCFEVNADGRVFLCHMVDILNVMNSNDIALYTYTGCRNEEKVTAALAEIMTATEKYFRAIDTMMQSNGNKAQLWQSVMMEEEWDEIFEEDDLSLPENVCDMYYLSYYGGTDIAALKKDLEKRARRDTLENAYEKRAARVLAAMDKKEAYKRTRKNAKAAKLPAKDYLIMATPFILWGVLFAVPGCLLGIEADKWLYSGLFGRQHFEAALVGMMFAFLLSTIPAWFTRKPIYRILDKNNADNFADYDEELTMTRVLNALCGVGLVAICMLFYVLAFSGVAFSQSGEIVYRPFGLRTETYMLSETPIAIVKEDSDNDEYTETAYAFYLTDEWVEYGIPADEESKAIIEKAVSEKETPPKTYQTVYDIDT